MFKNLIKADTPVSVTLRAEDLQAFAKEVAENTIKALSNLNQEETVWLTPNQVCERLNINRATLWRWDKEGYLCGVKFGHRVRYRERDVNRVASAERKEGT